MSGSGEGGQPAATIAGYPPLAGEHAERCPICGAETAPAAAFAGVRRCDGCLWIGDPHG